MKKFVILVTAVAISMASFSQEGGSSAKASYYHSKFNGRKTATGETYWDHLLTAASNIYKLGTQLLVVNRVTGKKVKVVVNDRMAPHIKGRVDLSKSAFKKIASTGVGLVAVKVYVLDGKEDEDKDKAL